MAEEVTGYFLKIEPIDLASFLDKEEISYVTTPEDGYIFSSNYARHRAKLIFLREAIIESEDNIPDNLLLKENNASSS